MNYQLRYGSGIERDLSRLPKNVLKRIDKAILALMVDPRPRGSVKLSGHTRLFRIRVGNWRVVYEVDDPRGIVEIQIVAHRREIYRGL